ncbi:MAG: Ku protein [Bacillota bacterium]|jgi:DNA end-binding protein Ku|nr:Ku protein [Bacillota bacterium]HHU29642.1 Ku protein [Bacillota bacterium]
MRTIWKGAVSFGLVSIPVKLFPATEHKDVKFRYLHRSCQAPLQYKKICVACGKEVPQEEIVRGYEYEKGRFVIINEEDLERVPDEQTKTIDIMDFVALQEIDPVYFDKSYYLAPAEAGEKAYALLRLAMEETGKIAVAKIIIRTKESLAVIRGYQNLLVLETIFYPDEIRNPNQLPGFEREVKVKEKEMKMACELIENLATDFNPQKYEDTYRKQLLEMIQAKIAGEQIAVPEMPQQGKVVDLMDALKASVEMAKKTTGKSEKKSKRKRKKAAGE